MQQNIRFPSEVKCVVCYLIYINSDLFISTKREKWCNKYSVPFRSEMCRLLSDLHQLRSIYVYKKGEVVQQNTSSHSEVKCVDYNLIYIN